MKKLIILILAVLFINTDYFIRKWYWKNISKHQITGLLYFDDDDIILKNHRIYIKNNNGYKYRGYVILSLYKILILLNSENHLCYYVNHGKITHKTNNENLPETIIITKDTMIVEH